jgi:chromosome partitioning protein
MHVLAFVNQKGGCGKTTTAVNLAGALAARGLRALLVDLDPQAHATLALGCAPHPERTTLELLRGHLGVQGVVVAASGGIQLVPATTELADFEAEAEREIQPESRLAAALWSAGADYDVALLDCPPRADGVLSANALRAADTAVLVVESGAFALQGALRARALLEEVRGRRERPLSVRAVATLFDRRARIARELLVGMHAQLGPLLFDTAIRSSVRLRECAALGAPVQVVDPRGAAAADFRALAEEVVLHVTAAPRAADTAWAEVP